MGPEEPVVAMLTDVFAGYLGGADTSVTILPKSQFFDDSACDDLHCIGRCVGHLDPAFRSVYLTYLGRVLCGTLRLAAKCVSDARWLKYASPRVN